MKTGRMWKMQKGEEEDWKNVEKCRRGKMKTGRMWKNVEGGRGRMKVEKEWIKPIKQ